MILEVDSSIEQFEATFDENTEINEETILNLDDSFNDDSEDYELLEYLFDTDIQWEEIQGLKITKQMSLQTSKITQFEEAYDENLDVGENNSLELNMEFEESDEADTLLNYLFSTDTRWDTVDRFIVSKDDLSLQIPRIVENE